MGIATGEVFAYPEGKVYLYASASGTTSGSGLAYVKQATLQFTYGWQNRRTIDGNYYDLLTGQRVDMQGSLLFADTQLFRLVNASAAVNAKFEASAGAITQSAQFVLYSGKVTQWAVSQTEDGLFESTFAMYANLWSGFGQ